MLSPLFISCRILFHLEEKWPLDGVFSANQRDANPSAITVK
jgi:hypothetical protein